MDQTVEFHSGNSDQAVERENGNSDQAVECGDGNSDNDGAASASYFDFDGLLSPETPAAPKRPSYLDLLRYLGDDPNRIDYLRKNLGQETLRRSAEFWQGQEAYGERSKTRAMVFNVYRDALNGAARSICGQDAAIASVAAFRENMLSKKPKCDPSSLFHPLAAAMVTAKKTSIEYRTVRAILCTVFSAADVTQLAEEMLGFDIGKEAYYAGRDDFELLLSDGKLFKQPTSRERFDPEVADDAIKFILSYENVAYLSWGTKRIVYNGNYHHVPAILRQKPISTMFTNYLQRRTEGPHVSKRSFYRLCGILTHGEVDTRKAVDYVTDILVSDNVATLKQIILAFLSREQEELLRDLTTLCSWLKYGSFAEAPTSSSTYAAVADCPRHKPEFGLACPVRRVPSVEVVCCGPCLGMHKLLNHIIEAVKHEGADGRTICVVHDCFEKFELFMGHRLRVINQQRALAEIVDQMSTRGKRGEGLNEALVIIDFKMKAEPLFFRESTLAHYGKRGMSWHGALIQFWVADPDDEGRFSEQKVYYNHLSGADNRQDKEAVVGLVEAILLDIKRDLPQIDRVVLQSDNASCYQSAFASVMFPILGIANNITITRFIHSETQDGKSLLDAQFARAWAKVKSWARQGHNCTTPTELVAALISDGGLPNTMAEIIEHDRAALQLLAEQVTAIEKRLNAQTGRTNDTQFEYTGTLQVDTIGAFDIKRCPKFRLKIFAYSGIGSGQSFEINTRLGTCSLCSNGENSLPEPISSHGDEHFASSDGDMEVGVDESCESEEAFSDEEADLDLSSEVLLPEHTVGRVTGIQMTTKTQIRRRTRKWNCSNTSVMPIPASRNQRSPKEKTLTSYAKESLLSMRSAGVLGVVEVSDLPKKMIEFIDKYSCDDDAPPAQLQEGWARRPAKGHMYGAKYIDFYMDDVKELYERGALNKSDKMGPARMIEELRARYPDRHDIPGENEVRTAISRLLAQQRAASSKTNVGGDHQPPSKRRRMDKRFDDYLKNLIHMHPRIAPREAVVSFRDSFPDANDLVEDSQLKSKVSYLKGLAKR